jgi:translation initiation factor IF-2
MGILDRFRKKTEEVEIVSRRPVGSFKVEKVLKVLTRQVLVGEVLEGLIYPGYKLKGRKAGVVMKIEKDHREVDFAVAGDRVALTLENEIPCEENETLEIYQS